MLIKRGTHRRLYAGNVSLAINVLFIFLFRGLSIFTNISHTRFRASTVVSFADELLPPTLVIAISQQKQYETELEKFSNENLQIITPNISFQLDEYLR